MVGNDVQRGYNLKKERMRGLKKVDHLEGLKKIMQAVGTQSKIPLMLSIV